MNVLVTGGGGFIGQATCRALLRAGYIVKTFDRRDGNDVLDRDQLFDAMRDQSAVVHLAGMLGTSELLDSPATAIDVNMRGTLNVLEACRMPGYERAHYVGITMPDVWPSLYQATKIGAQRIAEAYNNAHEIPVTHVRAFNAWGPGQAFGEGHPQKIVPTFVTRALTGAPLPVWGNGEQTCDLVHVDDLGDLLALAVIRSLAADDETCGAAQTWDAGTGVQSRVIEIARTIIEVTESSSTIEWLPMRAGELPDTKLAAEAFMPGARRPLHWLDDDTRLKSTIEYYAAAVAA